LNIKVIGSNDNHIDVVFSHVVMAVITGIDFAGRIRDQHHDMPVPLMSGSDHVLAKNGTYGFELLHRPFSAEQHSRLLRKDTTWKRHKRITVR
jgi:two-component SAPR family response regulator